MHLYVYMIYTYMCMSVYLSICLSVCLCTYVCMCTYACVRTCPVQIATKRATKLCAAKSEFVDTPLSKSTRYPYRILLLRHPIRLPEYMRPYIQYIRPYITSTCTPYTTPRKTPEDIYPVSLHTTSTKTPYTTPWIYKTIHILYKTIYYIYSYTLYHFP